MQGRWKLVYYEVEGKPVDPAMKALTGLMEIKADRMLNFFRLDCQLILTASCNPKSIDAVGTEKSGREAPVVGIYKLEGDTLTICWPRMSRMLYPERPADFEAPCTLCRLERERP